MKKKKIKVNDTNHVSSPEELDAYIRIARPGVWVGLGAVVALLVGMFVWGFVGRVEVQVSSVSHIKKDATDNLVTYINSRDFKNVKENQTIRLDNGKEIILKSIESKPIVITEETVKEDLIPLEVVSKGNWAFGDIVYIASSDNTVTKIGSGTYSSIVVTGSMAPMSFVFNF